MMTNIISIVLSAVPAPMPADGDMFSWLLGSVKWIMEQFAQKNYAPAVAGIIMIATFFFNKFAADKLPVYAKPWISAALGIVMAMVAKVIGMAAGASTPDLLQAILTGFMAGASASGFWSMLGKHFLGAKDEGNILPEPAPESTVTKDDLGK